MKDGRFYMHKPDLVSERHLKSLVEHQTTFSLNNCEFSIFETHRAAYNIRLHFDHLAFTGMLRGKKNMKIDGKTGCFDYLPGESVLVAPGETIVIDFPDADETPSQCMAISLNPEFVQNALEQFNFYSPKEDETSSWSLSGSEYHLFNSPSLASATNNLMRIAMDNSPQKDLIADFALKELLIRLMQTQAGSLLRKNVGKPTSRIGHVVAFIRENLHQKLTTDMMAKKACTSKSGFFKIFKEELGISPNEFIVHERIRKAKELLSKNQSVKETAFQTGFSDTNYFIRVFRQIEGITPGNFQTQYDMQTI